MLAKYWRFPILRCTFADMTEVSERRPWVELTVLREKDGASKTQLARAAHMSLGYLCDLENGQREPNATVRKKLATALNVPVSMLEKRHFAPRVVA